MGVSVVGGLHKLGGIFLSCTVIGASFKSLNNFYESEKYLEKNHPGESDFLLGKGGSSVDEIATKGSRNDRADLLIENPESFNSSHESKQYSNKNHLNENNYMVECEENPKPNQEESFGNH